jgi:hypothetical protein
MTMRHAVPVLSAFAALALPAFAHASGGNYVFDGGTPAEQATVRAALNASSFDWSRVPAQIVIHIERGAASEATPGQITLDASLLDSGRFASGVVQHEYAHQVDFFLLDEAKRARLASVLGGTTWWAPGATSSMAPNGSLKHAQLSSERFASTLAWAYWQSPENCMRPKLAGAESGTVKPAAFRALLEKLLS